MSKVEVLPEADAKDGTKDELDEEEFGYGEDRQAVWDSDDDWW